MRQTAITPTFSAAARWTCGGTAASRRIASTAMTIANGNAMVNAVGSAINSMAAQSGASCSMGSRERIIKMLIAPATTRQNTAIRLATRDEIDRGTGVAMIV